jgi:hypothetical protein
LNIQQECIHSLIVVEKITSAIHTEATRRYFPKYTNHYE